MPPSSLVLVPSPRAGGVRERGEEEGGEREERGRSAVAVKHKQKFICYVCKSTRVTKQAGNIICSDCGTAVCNYSLSSLDALNSLVIYQFK
jgi:ribosomal protein L37AE/L43A